MIIYFTPGGRLGNQLFQYARVWALAKPGERILLSLMEQFLSAFEPSGRIRNIPRGLFLKIVERAALPIVRAALVRTGIISSIIEKDGIETQKTGLCSRITWVEGYFQNPEAATQAFLSKLKVREQHRLKVQDFIDKNGLDGKKWMYVHVRRTDYLNYRILDTIDPSLPVRFYRAALEALGAATASTTLVAIGDDTGFLARELGVLGWTVIESPLSPAEDFELISRAPAGVVSNSTFAWWAALSGGQRAVGPLYWLGWKRGAWYPESMHRSTTIEWIEVPR